MARVESVEFRVREVRYGRWYARVRRDEDQGKIREQLENERDYNIHWDDLEPVREIVDEHAVPERDQ